MMTAPERCPSETILTGIFRSARSITSGASMYAAWIRPAINDSLTSGQPLYLLYSNSNCGPPPFAALLAAARAAQATGSVRLHVTGRPPTRSGFGVAAGAAFGQVSAGRTAPRAPRRSVRRGRSRGGRGDNAGRVRGSDGCALSVKAISWRGPEFAQAVDPGRSSSENAAE